MTSLFLTYFQRVMLGSIVGGHQVPNLKMASIYLRIIEKVRLTDEEVTASQFIQDQAKSTWVLPELGYGDMVIEFEGDECKAIVDAIEAAQNIRVSDAGWLNKMIDSLKAKKVEPVEADKV